MWPAQSQQQLYWGQWPSGQPATVPANPVPQQTDPTEWAAKAAQWAQQQQAIGGVGVVGGYQGGQELAQWHQQGQYLHQSAPGFGPQHPHPGHAHQPRPMAPPPQQQQQGYYGNNANLMGRGIRPPAGLGPRPGVTWSQSNPGPHGNPFQQQHGGGFLPHGPNAPPPPHGHQQAALLHASQQGPGRYGLPAASSSGHFAPPSLNRPGSMGRDSAPQENFMSRGEQHKGDLGRDPSGKFDSPGSRGQKTMSPYKEFDQKPQGDRFSSKEVYGYENDSRDLMESRSQEMEEAKRLEQQQRDLEQKKELERLREREKLREIERREMEQREMEKLRELDEEKREMEEQQREEEQKESWKEVEIAQQEASRWGLVGEEPKGERAKETPASAWSNEPLTREQWSAPDNEQGLPLPSKEQVSISSSSVDRGAGGIPGLGELAVQQETYPPPVEEKGEKGKATEEKASGKSNQVLESLGKIVSQLQTLQGLSSSLKLLQKMPKSEREEKVKEIEKEEELSEETKKKVAALLANESDSETEDMSGSQDSRSLQQGGPDSFPPSREFEGTFDVKPQVYKTYDEEPKYDAPPLAVDQEEEEGDYPYSQIPPSRPFPQENFPRDFEPRHGPPGWDRPREPHEFDRMNARGDNFGREREPPYHRQLDVMQHRRPRDVPRDVAPPPAPPPAWGRGLPPPPVDEEIMGYKKGGGGYDQPIGEFMDPSGQWLPPDEEELYYRGAHRHPLPPEPSRFPDKPISSKLQTIDYSHGTALPKMQSVDYHHRRKAVTESDEDAYLDAPENLPPKYPPPAPYTDHPVPAPPGAAEGGMLPHQFSSYSSAPVHSDFYPPPPLGVGGGEYGGFGPRGGSGYPADPTAGYFPPGFDPTDPTAAALFVAYTSQAGDRKRKTLPLWLRDALEKLDVERQKKLEKETRESTRQEAHDGRPTWRDELDIQEEDEEEMEVEREEVQRGKMAEQQQRQQEDMAVPVERRRTRSSPTQGAGQEVEDSWKPRVTRIYRTVAQSKSHDETSHASKGEYQSSSSSSSSSSRKRRSGFADQHEDEEEKQLDLIIKVRKMLTEILLEVTNSEIVSLAEETLEEERRPKISFPLKKEPRLLTGLSMYESDSEEDGGRKEKSLDPVIDVNKIADAFRDTKQQGSDGGGGGGGGGGRGSKEKKHKRSSKDKSSSSYRWEEKEKKSSSKKLDEEAAPKKSSKRKSSSKDSDSGRDSKTSSKSHKSKSPGHKQSPSQRKSSSSSRQRKSRSPSPMAATKSEKDYYSPSSGKARHDYLGPGKGKESEYSGKGKESDFSGKGKGADYSAEKDKPSVHSRKGFSGKLYSESGKDYTTSKKSESYLEKKKGGEYSKDKGSEYLKGSNYSKEGSYSKDSSYSKEGSFSKEGSYSKDSSYSSRKGDYSVREKGSDYSRKDKRRSYSDYPDSGGKDKRSDYLGKEKEGGYTGRNVYMVGRESPPKAKRNKFVPAFVPQSSMMPDRFTHRPGFP